MVELVPCSVQHIRSCQELFFLLSSVNCNLIIDGSVFYPQFQMHSRHFVLNNGAISLLVSFCVIKLLPMPELPDLQVFSSNLRKLFKRKKLTRLNIVNGKRIKTSAVKFKKALEKSIRDFLDIHNSRKQKSPSGAKIKHETIGGRKTYYTDEQTLYK